MNALISFSTSVRKHFTYISAFLSAEVKSRTQGSRPRPRTQKKIRDQGQGQECSRPRPRTKDTNASVFLKKKGLKNCFSLDLKKKKKRSRKTFFSRSTKFQPFKKLCCPRAENRAIFEDLRLRGQGLENVSSRTSSRPRTSSRTPPLLIRLVLYQHLNSPIAYHKHNQFSSWAMCEFRC